MRGPFRRFLVNPRPAWSFVYYSKKQSFGKTNVVFPELLLCKIAIFALLRVFHLVICHTYLKMFEENKAMKTTKGGFWFLFFFVLFALYIQGAILAVQYIHTT